ncbi:hypothetical protein C5167_015951 [Papaver somniferum]|nr:hypothetical protein C5167_015951 [Papaver somniferum]
MEASSQSKLNIAAQLVEHMTFKHVVVGSTPTDGIYFGKLHASKLTLWVPYTTVLAFIGLLAPTWEFTTPLMFYFYLELASL